MTTKDSGERKTANTTADPVDPGLAVEPRVGCSILVSFAEDGTPSMDIALALVAPGDEIIWHTAADETRAFSITLERSRPSCHDDRGAGTSALFPVGGKSAGKPCRPEAAPPRIETVSDTSGGEVLVSSWSERVVRIRIGDHTEVTRYECIVAAIGAASGLLFNGGIIVRPPKRRPLANLKPGTSPD
ncbi:MAG: hypothetical protein H7Y19_16450 [Luteimonas sp.]|nr:hypothetical protein [Luteimonas sp.]